MTFSRCLADDSLAIFLFHGVIEEHKYTVRNYTRKHVLACDFAKIIRDLRKHGAPVSMDQVIGHARAGERLPPKAFAITFDDGFANNASIAAPILADCQVPATFYVTTGFIEANAMSWIDRIEYCLECASSGELSLPWSATNAHFSSPEHKIEILGHIRWHVKRSPTLDVEDLVADIFRQTSVQPIVSSTDPLDQKLSWQEVRQLSENPLFAVGGHTHTHAILSFLPQDELEREITTCLSRLSDLAQVAPRHFSYPEGLRHCYNDNVIATLKANGVECCPTAENGVNSCGEDLFHLRRIMVG